jgi:hypothetical protein
MIDFDASTRDEIMRQLSVNAEVMRALVGTIPGEQAQWKPDPDTWSMAEVMSHVFNEERGDFRRHLKEIFSDPPKAWDEISIEWTPVSDCRQALDGFLAERWQSLAWLKGLDSPDWDRKMAAPWGGEISAGDLLVSWVAHDYLHLRQMNELVYAWNEKQAAPFSVAYAGGW